MIYLLIAEISCDEYIPSFLCGKLGMNFAYTDFGIAYENAENLFNEFIKWINNDPSCSTKPKLDITRPNISETPTIWKCDIDDGSAWFKVTIEKSEVNKCLL